MVISRGQSTSILNCEWLVPFYLFFVSVCTLELSFEGRIHSKEILYPILGWGSESSWKHYERLPAFVDVPLTHCAVSQRHIPSPPESGKTRFFYDDIWLGLQLLAKMRFLRFYFQVHWILNVAVIIRLNDMNICKDTAMSEKTQRNRKWSNVEGIEYSEMLKGLLRLWWVLCLLVLISVE